MSRFLPIIPALLIVGAPARADRIAPAFSPAERALRAPVVVVGKVTAIEKDTIDARAYPGAANKLAYKIAVVKIETGLAGTDGVTHVKIGFTTGRRYETALTEGQEALFFLTKHHEGPFYIVPYMAPPMDAKAANFKQQVEEAKTVLALVADPAKALKAEKAEDRFAAAVAVVFQLRMPRMEAPRGTEAVALTADESRPILKALAEGAWKVDRFDQTLNGYRSFVLLGLTEADGWKPPAPEAGKDVVELTRAAYIKWLDGPGKDYRIKKLVPKK
ncbi:MAG: hypothetical protein J0I06_24880 [Planctomycetes bacterium]|nr:hypothetical protein [Planctomycetota bacterium]